MTAGSHSFDYAAAIRSICRDFPAVAARIYFFDTLRKENVAGHPQANRMLADIANKQENFAKQLKGFIEQLHGDKSSCVFNGEQKDYFVFLYNGPQQGGLLSHLPQTQRLYFILDHEIGHIVTPTGKPDKTKSATLHEATADVFASLRHIQRFGRETGAVEDLLLLRAQRMVSLRGERHPEHFTSFVLEKLLEELSGLKIENLSPQQTATLASKIAESHTPPDRRISRIAAAFAPFRDVLAANGGGDDPYRVLAAIILGSRDPDVVKCGAPVLCGYIDGRLKDMRNGKEYVRVNAEPLGGEFWSDIRRKLTEKEFSFNGSLVLAGSDAVLCGSPPVAQKFNPSPSNRKD